MKAAGVPFKQGLDAIPNVFHNTITLDGVGSAAFQAGAIGGVTGLRFGPGPGLATGAAVFGGNMIYALGYRTAKNFVSNGYNRGRLLGEFLGKRADCKKLLS